MTELPQVTALNLELQNGWLTIWFDQPESRNALTSELVEDLRRTLESVKSDQTIRGITLRGTGGVFCAGGDLKSFKAAQAGSQTFADVVETSIRGAEIFDQINHMPQVVIVIIEGAAMAGGFGIACCADVVICDVNAKFAMTETAIGLTPAQIAPFVIQKLGYSTARRLMLSAARFSGSDSKALGFADFLGETVEQLEAHEWQIRKQVLRCAPGAVAAIKSLILETPQLSRVEVVQAAANNFANRMMSDEGKEGVASFVEKRKPNWVAMP